jgi:toxin ParE1/3/4
VTVVWSDEALDDIEALRAYIEQDDPAAALRVVQLIFESTRLLLSAGPNVGRPGRVPGTRELVIPRTPFIVPYWMSSGKVYVLRVYHGARRWPEKF